MSPRPQNAAWGVVRHDERFHGYYEKLRAEGRSYRETMIVIARKLLRILLAVQKNGTPYSAEECWATV